MAHYLIYIRRSYKRADAADVSDETQEQVARGLLPPGSSVEVVRDSGGHNSGATDEREGYQRLIARVREGGVAGVAVYDLSRLARNVRLMSNLKAELERQQVAILAGNLPNTKHDSAVGRFMFNMVVSAAQFQRDLDSERMTAMMRATFLDGGHRGGDPFGYRSIRGADGRVAQPRALEVVRAEADVVRRVFELLAHHSFSDTAAILNRDGVRHRTDRAWTPNAVKDIWRRRDQYRPAPGHADVGSVIAKRGLEVRPGKHPPILDEGIYRDAVAGVEARKHHKGPRPIHAKRLYLLRGLVYCSCGARMRGDTRLSRGQEWRYYSCPVSEGRGGHLDAEGNLVVCHARRVPADAAEAFVLESLGRFAVPDDVVEAAREELRQRLRAPALATTDGTRARLKTRLEKLVDLYSWGDIAEPEYRKQKAAVDAEIAKLPANDELILFDRHRAVIRSLGDSLAVAPGEKRQELVAALVERVETREQEVVRVVWTPPARPFFATAAAESEDGATALAWRPRTDSNRRRRP